MANLKEIRIRIGSVNTTQQITKAMKLVAASKLKRAQDRILQMRPYSEKLNEILSNLLSSMEGEAGATFSKKREEKNVLIVVLTSDKGLCGGFNSNIIKAARKLITENYAAQKKAGNVTLLCVGKKGYDFFKKDTELRFINDHISLMAGLSFDKSQAVSQSLMNAFADAKYDVIELVYAKFKNAATQLYSVERFLPVEPSADSKTSKTKADYIFEPNKELLLEELVPKILNTQFYKALLDTNASEHGARMVAMESATNNANDLIRSLKIVYNRERQAAITKEILEIVGGAAALEDKG
ncbi:MAG: ATP synthase F1 subunit gamma [Bacteroidetes bacterium]|nr:ATP synthase F1 subunit gamma [Bacteroidota bacterium]MBK8658246.1 ATP synthase F1 subunit gamma [Bacteroidota bacterium]